VRPLDLGDAPLDNLVDTVPVAMTSVWSPLLKDLL
jgi:hypothetical protein